MKTAKDFVLLCIDNEIYRYKEAIKNWEDERIKEYNYVAIKVLWDFRENISNNL